MRRRDGLEALAAGATVVLGGALSALAGHLVLDVLGDFVLERDAYDDLPHVSYARFAALALIALCLALGSGFGALLARRRGDRSPAVALARASQRGRLLPRLLAAVLSGCALLCAMHVLDVLAAGRAVDDVSDWFGGSLALGLAVEVPFALAAALVLRALARSMGSFAAVMAVLAGALLAPRFGADSRPRDRRERAVTPRASCLTLARSLPKRGPPPPRFAFPH
jgi:hypothetical protein